MRQRELIEGDLIQATARLHDLAISGIGAENLDEMRLLTEAITKLTREGYFYVPQVVQFSLTAGELIRDEDRLESGSGP